MKRLAPFLLALALPAFAFAAAHAPAHTTTVHEALAHPEATAAHDGGHGGDKATPFAGTIAQSIAALLVFGVVAVVLRTKAWGPILKGLTDRENKIRGDLEAAEAARLEAQRSLESYRQQIASAEAQVRDKLTTAQKDAEAIGTRLKIDAQREIEEMKTRATRELEEQKNAALAEVRQHAAQLSTSVAGKILRRQINESDQADLIRASLEELQGAGARR